MKKYVYLIIIVLISSLVLAGCSVLSNVGQVPANEQSGITYLTKGVPSGLVGLWHFDETSGTTASDSSGNGNTGTLVNGPLWVSGKFDNALSFDGANDYVEILDSFSLDLTTGITVEAWVKFNSAAMGEDSIIARKWNAYSLQKYTDDKLEGWVKIGGTWYGVRGITGGTALTSDTWYHLAFTYDNANVRTYINGLLDRIGTVAGDIDTTTGNASIGTDLEGSGAYTAGTIDEVRIWDRALQLVDILNPDISVEKSGPESAHVGDIITYDYTVTNTGYVPLSDVDVIDSLGITVSYDSGDTNTNELLDLEEDWMFTANYIVPDGVDLVENTAIASGMSLLGLVESDPADWSVDIFNPVILVEKSGPEAAYPGDTVTYDYIVTNTGNCTLYNVLLVDDVVVPVLLTGLTDEDGDTTADDLAQGASATYTADYLVTFGDPEWLVNTATASGTDELGLTVDDEASWTVHTMGARSIGYWKNHSNDWCDFPSGSMFNGETWETLSQFFPGSGAQADGVNPLEMLRAQLIAAELNYACFEDDFHYARYEAADIFGTMRDAEALLQRVYLAAGDDDLNAYWLVLSKQQQNNVKKIANPLKGTLEEFNAMGDEIFE